MTKPLGSLEHRLQMPATPHNEEPPGVAYKMTHTTKTAAAQRSQEDRRLVEMAYARGLIPRTPYSKIPEEYKKDALLPGPGPGEQHNNHIIVRAKEMVEFRDGPGYEAAVKAARKAFANLGRNVNA